MLSELKLIDHLPLSKISLNLDCPVIRLALLGLEICHHDKLTDITDATRRFRWFTVLFLKWKGILYLLAFSPVQVGICLCLFIIVQGPQEEERKKLLPVLLIMRSGADVPLKRHFQYLPVWIHPWCEQRPCVCLRNYKSVCYEIFTANPSLVMSLLFLHHQFTMNSS